MAFRLLDKTVQNKTFAAPIGVIKAGRNRIGAVGQLDTTTIAKAPGGPFSISWAARNDDTAPGTVGLALLDGSGQLFARTDGVILSPGEERTLNLNVPAEEIADPLGWADEEVWTIAMIVMAWEDAPDPKSEDFTNLAYSSPTHTFIVSYTEAKQKLFNKAKKANKDVLMWKGNPPVSVMVKAEMVPSYIADGWTYEKPSAMTNQNKLVVVDPNIKIKKDWLSALQANGLSQDELSLDDFQSGFLPQVLSNREAKTKQEDDKKAFIAAWGNMREEMGESGFAVPGPSYPGYGWEAEFATTRDSYADRRDYNSVFKLALRNNPTITQKQPEYSPGWQNRLSGWTDRAVTQAETERVTIDKMAWNKEKNRTGVTVPYSANWQSALKNAVSKRDSDAIRDRLAKETKARQDAIREAAAAIRVATELRIQRAKEASVLRRAQEALAAQKRRLAAEQSSWVDDTPAYRHEVDIPSDYVSTRRDTPAVVPDRSPTPAASKETSTERNRIAPVYVSKYIDHRQSGGNSRVVESSSGNFLTIFTHEATGDEGDWDDFI